VIQWLDAQIRQVLEDGFPDFITGMQRGVDIWAAETVMKLRSKEPAAIRLIAAVAFRGMENRCCHKRQMQYRHILNAAEEVHYISGKPGRTAFVARNCWMADRASRLIAVYTGAPEGTRETIRYVKTQGREILNIQRSAQDSFSAQVCLI
jgi:uncharacterized phage-like protein YoqJ